MRERGGGGERGRVVGCERRCGTEGEGIMTLLSRRSALWPNKKISQ